LARALYKDVEIDHPVPEALFVAVAEVLAYVYKMGKKKK
jgi:flagellar biosynthetic protein FlhB